MKLRRLWWLPGLILACGDQAAPTAKQAQLEAGAVANVAEERILAETVGRIAATRNIDPADARDLAVQNALAAAAARADLPPWEVEAAERRVLARAMLREIIISAREGPITDDELGRATETYWTHYARPRGYRTIHAVMLAPTDAPPETHAAARERVADIREAWRPIVEKLRGTEAPEYDDAKMFRWNARAMTEPIKAKLEEAAKAAVGEMGLKVQQLPPVTSEGYIVDHDQSQSSLDAAYSRAASQLEERGEMSGIVQSTSGWHVIVLLETTPPRVVGKAQRREALRGFIYRVRAEERLAELLGQLREKTAIPSDHAALLQLVELSAEG